MMIPVAEAVISQLREGIRQKKDKLRAKKDSIVQLEDVNKRQQTSTGACEILLYRFQPRFFSSSSLVLKISKQISKFDQL